MFSSDIYVRGKYASWLKFLSEKAEKMTKAKKLLEFSKETLMFI